MANASEQSAVTARTGKPFTFTRTRIVSNVTTTAEFFPGAGSTLRFANRDTDTLNAVGIPAGLLQAGDSVTVKYLNTTVFQGTVERIVDRHGRGDDRVQDVTCQGPWGKMNRLVYRQLWGIGTAQFSSSRVILNQTPGGLAQSMAAQLNEIVTFAAAKCGFTAGTIQADTLVLPADETRDITCADAIRRMLRFHPKRIVRFDYSGSTPALNIVEPSGNDASYVATIPKTQREYVYNAHPVSCVDITTDATDILLSDGTSAIPHQIYPVNADTTDLDCLHVTIPLAPGSASTTWESFDSVTENMPSSMNDAIWWKNKHPRLANVPNNAFGVYDGDRSPANYPRIAKSTKGELEAAGLHCEVSRCSCKCRIQTADDEEEDIVLTMDFLTTDATTRKYTWQTGSSWSAGETLPDGLAQAIYEQRGGALLNERMTIRLGSAFPQLGDMADGLYLQSFDVDLADLTARLEFGQPEHLAVEDLKNLLNGFRQRGYAENAVLRSSAGGGEEEEEDDTPGGIPPIASSEWSPGKKSKTTIAGSGSGSVGSVVIDSSGSSPKINLSGGSGGSVDIDCDDLDSNETLGIHDFKECSVQGCGSLSGVKVLATDDITVPGIQAAADSGISLGYDSQTNCHTFENTGVKQIVAGTGVSISSANNDGKGVVTISATGGGGGGSISSITLTPGSGILINDSNQAQTGTSFTIKAVYV